ncbi:MAG: hypothetical protein WBO77_01480 [Microgenomates group bacterium]
MVLETRFGRRIAATGLAVAGLVLARDHSKEANQRYALEAQQQLPPIAEHIQDRYGIDITFPTGVQNHSGKIIISEATEERKLIGARIVRAELAKLPPSFMRNIGPKMIALSGLIQVDYSYRLGSTHAKKSHMYLLSRDRALLSESAERYDLQRAFHHENEHFADFSGDGSLEDNYLSDDTEWTALNGSEQQVDRVLFFPGFVSLYSQADDGEDQAEIGALLFAQGTDAGNEEFDSFADDQIVQAKIDEMKRRYAMWSDGLISDQYWIDLRAGTVDEAYWNERDVNRD